MFQAQIKSKFAFCSGLISIACYTVNSKRFSYTMSDTIPKGDNPDIGLYLTENSKVSLKAFLKKYGMENHQASSVWLKGSVKQSDLHIYKPIFGQRVVFRLKGIISLSNGDAVGFGRLSCLSGELKDSDFVVSMPMYKISNLNGWKKDPWEVRLLQDLPSRVPEQAFGSTSWSGILPSISLNGISYKEENIICKSIPFNKQILVEGYLCSSNYVDKDGNCLYDITNDLEEDSTPISNDSKESIEEENSDECPVCRYIKKGPCKSDFEIWDKCMQNIQGDDDLTKCFDVTMTMMRCMKQYEYYDVMVAGTDTAKYDALNAISNESVTITEERDK
eukprot:gene7985-10828_t